MLNIIFVSGVINESHLVYVASYIEKIKVQYNLNFKIYYEYNFRFLSDQKIDTSIVEKWLGQVTYIKHGSCVRTGFRCRIIHLFIGSVGIKPIIQMRLRNLFSKITNVVIDEGIGSVSDINTMKNVYVRERNLSQLQAYLYAFIYLYVKRGFLAKNIWRLFNGITPNEKLMHFIKKKCEPLKVENSSYVLLLTQPWVKLGVLTEREYHDYVLDLIKHVTDANLKLVVKPHPSEDIFLYESLKLNLIRCKTPIELCFDHVYCKSVIGFNSTSLILLNAIYNVPTYRLRYGKLEDIVTFSPQQESLFNKYSSNPMSFVEISKILNASEQ